MYAMLERAVRDLAPCVTDEPQHLRSAVLWFKNKIGATGFMYSDVIEELKLTKHCQELIQSKLTIAEEYVRSRDRQLAIEKQHKLEREREARRAVSSTLAKRSQLSFRPEKPTVQWNGWNIGRYSG